MSVAQVTGVLTANNLTLPSGQLSDGGTKIPVSTIGRSDLAGGRRGPRRRLLDAGRRRAVPVDPNASPATATVARRRLPRRAAPTPITIGDLGHGRAVEVATTGYARTNGKPSLSLSVTKTSDANTVLVAEAVQDKLDEIAARHPGVIVVTTVSDLSDFIKESTDGLIREGGLGALFAVLTIFLFLFSVRSTLVAAISIPLSILTALVVMQLTGISLNIMTLGGLAVAVGRVVDDAIVVLENIYRHRALGEDRWTAVHQRPARGRRGDHRQHADDGRGLPAARLRRRPRQPVLPAVRADRHLRAAGVAHLRADGRAGPRLLPHRQGQGQGRRGRRAGQLASGSGSTRRSSRSSCARAGRRSASSRCRASCSSPRWPSSASCRPSSSTPARRRSSRSASRRRRGATLGGRPRARHRGRDDPRRRRGRRARPDEHPRRGRHELPDHHRRPERPAGQQRDDDGPARSDASTSPSKTAEFSERPRADQDRRLRRPGLARPPASPPTA